MRMGEDDFFHLTYCSNIHPAEEWKKTFLNLKQYALPLKASLSPFKPFGIGLRLSDLAAQELLAEGNLGKFKEWLSDNQLYIFTINGFVYGNFHGQRIKEQAYAPDWSNEGRRNYSLNLVCILKALTPEGGENGFSTSPISYKPWLNKEQRLKTFDTACFHIAHIVAEMVQIDEREGKLLHIDIEPEPDCSIATATETVQFFKEWLLTKGTTYLADFLKISPLKAEVYMRRHVRLCYDICHFAVEFEDHAHIFQELKKEEILIGKIQISAALKFQASPNPLLRKDIHQSLIPLTESPYLHQVTTRDLQGRLSRYPDLAQVLPEFDDMPSAEWRTHFHVPIFLETYHRLQSTQQDIIAVLDLVQQNKTTRYLEIETYTWEVLPSPLKLDLLSSIQREYEWVLQKFQPDKD